MVLAVVPDRSPSVCTATGAAAAAAATAVFVVVHRRSTVADDHARDLCCTRFERQRIASLKKKIYKNNTTVYVMLQVLAEYYPTELPGDRRNENGQLFVIKLDTSRVSIIYTSIIYCCSILYTYRKILTYYLIEIMDIRLL